MGHPGIDPEAVGNVENGRIGMEERVAGDQRYISKISSTGRMVVMQESVVEGPFPAGLEC